MIPAGDGALQAVGAADGQDPVSPPHAVRVAQPGDFQRLAGIDLDHRQVGEAVAADDLGGKFLARDQFHPNLIGAVDDVIVGEDVPLGVDHESRAQSLALLTSTRRQFAPEEAVEEVEGILEPLSPSAAPARHPEAMPDHGFGVDVDHGPIDRIRDLGESGRQLRGRRNTEGGGRRRQAGAERLIHQPPGNLAHDQGGCNHSGGDDLVFHRLLSPFFRLFLNFRSAPREPCTLRWGLKQVACQSLSGISRGNKLFIVMVLWKRFPDSTDWTVLAKRAVLARPEPPIAPILQTRIADAAYRGE